MNMDSLLVRIPPIGSMIDVLLEGMGGSLESNERLDTCIKMFSGQRHYLKLVLAGSK